MARIVRSAVALLALVVPGCSTGPKPDPRGLEPYGRYLGALELARSGDAVDVRELVSLLDDPEPLARDGAVVALGRLGRPDHVPLLVEMTYDKVYRKHRCATHADVVRWAPGTCPACGAALVEATLEYYCPEHPDAVHGAPGACARCKGALKERREAGQERNTPLVRADACRALARLRDPRAVPALVSALRGDGSADVKRTAALALEPFKDEPGVLEALVDALGDASVQVAHGAHATLCRIAGRDDLPRAAAPWREWLKQRPPK